MLTSTMMKNGIHPKLSHKGIFLVDVSWKLGCLYSKYSSILIFCKYWQKICLNGNKINKTSTKAVELTKVAYEKGIAIFSEKAFFDIRSCVSIRID